MHKLLLNFHTCIHIIYTYIKYTYMHLIRSTGISCGSWSDSLRCWLHDQSEHYTLWRYITLCYVFIIALWLCISIKYNYILVMHAWWLTNVKSFTCWRSIAVCIEWVPGPLHAWSTVINMMMMMAIAICIHVHVWPFALDTHLYIAHVYSHLCVMTSIYAYKYTVKAFQRNDLSCLFTILPW